MVDEQFTQWLLESEIPSLRYLTRKNLQRLDQNDPLVIEDLRLMESSGPIPAILAGQASAGNWEGERTYYSPKYSSTHWSMLLLHELGLDSGHGDFRNGIDHINFPLFYQTDTLFVLRVLAELEQLSHPGAESALAWLIGRRAKTGRWRGSSPFRQRTWKNFADKEETDRWVSYFAASILYRYEQ